MTEPLTKLIVDCTTGEQVIVPLTAEEISQREADARKLAEELAAQEEQERIRAAAKQSAQDKLKGLGLSDIEIAALVGA